MSADTDSTSNCYAHGCPMLGTNTRSTTGSKEWLCMNHFGADASRWQTITHELRRLVWMVEATRLIRMHAGKASMDQYRERIARDINNAMCPDLLQQDHEYDQQWGIRIEGVLAASCRATVVQNDLAGATQP